MTKCVYLSVLTLLLVGACTPNIQYSSSQSLYERMMADCIDDRSLCEDKYVTTILQQPPDENI